MKGRHEKILVTKFDKFDKNYSALHSLYSWAGTKGVISTLAQGSPLGKSNREFVWRFRLG